MRPTTAYDDNIFDFNALLHPGTMFEHPRDVVAHPNLASPRSAPSWHPGHLTRRRSRPARLCGRPRA